MEVLVNIVRVLNDVSLDQTCIAKDASAFRGRFRSAVHVVDIRRALSDDVEPLFKDEAA